MKLSKELPVVVFISVHGGGLLAKLCSTLATPWTVACKASLSMEFSRQEYWRELPFPSLISQLVKNLPAMHETWVQSLGWENPLEKGKATHSSILAWRIPWTV